MSLVERAQIVAYMLNIYAKVQEQGGLPYQKREVLELFHKIITARDMAIVEEVTLKFINEEVVE